MAKICSKCGKRYSDDTVVCTDDSHALTGVASGLPFADGLIADRFPAVREIGSGAMGTVYLAIHTGLRAPLAIKLIRQDYIGDVDAIARFRREAENAFRIVHPNVVRVYDLLETAAGELAIVMEYVDGAPLTDFVPDLALAVEQMNGARVCRLIWQLAAGLDAAHAMGIAHRDLKPANIMVCTHADGSELAKLVDFGLAKAVHLPAQNVSHEGEFVGTPEYASPEQASFDRADERTDLYALGLIAFELLTGSLPFPRGATAQVLAQRATTSPRTLSDVAPSLDWPTAAQRVFDRALATDRDARYETAGQFARELNEALTIQRPTVRRTGQTTSVTESPASETTFDAATATPAVPRLHGHVKNYSLDRRVGLIRRDDGTEHRVHQQSIMGPGLRVLVEGECVEFEAGASGHDADAKRVKRLDPRFYGTVADFDFDLGYGWVIPDKESRRVFVHYRDVVSTGRGVVSLEDGERIEFEIISTPKGDKAVRVLRLDPRSPLARFADMGNVDEHLAALAGIAQVENWNYREQATKDQYPILRSYIYFTFPRLLEEGKIAEQKDARGRAIACFNTGLVTRLQEEIFAYFEAAPPMRARDPNSEFAPPAPWVFRGFLKRDDRRLSHFASPPTIANYFTNPADLLYDLAIELVPDWDHILLRKKRFPKSLQQMDDTVLKRLISQTIDDAKSRVRRNYKTAIPQFYRGTLQLLLPLCLEKPDRADLALVVMRDHRVYRATTVLPLDWAIRNARLIARPDREWLDP